jgi:hypothetical protein
LAWLGGKSKRRGRGQERGLCGGGDGWEKEKGKKPTTNADETNAPPALQNSNKNNALVEEEKQGPSQEA